MLYSNYTLQNAYFSFFAIKLLHEIVMLINDIERFQTSYKLYCVVVGKIQKVKKNI